MIKAYYNGNLQGRHFALWGLAFKPNTDDIREAPAVSIIEALTKAGATVTGCDSEAILNVSTDRRYNQIRVESVSGVSRYRSFDHCYRVESEFRTPDFERMEKEIKHKIIFDGPNLFDVYKMRDLGYHFESIDRG
jgi:UDPglucose 6-dehydrogenase